MTTGRLVRRRRRDIDPASFASSVAISHSRTVVVELPEGLPFDDRDVDGVCDEFNRLDPEPDEWQMPVASGLGDLVSSAFSVTYVNSPLPDAELVRRVTAAIRRGLRNRAWVVYPNRVRSGSPRQRKGRPRGR